MQTAARRGAAAMDPDTDPTTGLLDDADGADAERPSKSARKRAAHAAQALGERLIALREADLVQLDLPDALLAAVREARGIRARGGLARQRQYIGKLMRDIDLAPLEKRLGPALAPPRPRRAKPGKIR